MRKISYNYFASDWPRELSDKKSDLWSTGIDMIKDRFESRYFEPIAQVVNNSDKRVKYSCGFLVMSLDCLVIETLNQFYLGIATTTDKYHRGNKDPNFKWSWQSFRDFFKHSKFFKELESDIMAEVFYGEIRCGLLHQAQSKTNSLINVRKPSMVSLIDNADARKGLIINRKIFHEALIAEFKRYLIDLENPQSTNIFGENLREKCNQKMLDLCK